MFEVWLDKIIHRDNVVLGIRFEKNAELIAIVKQIADGRYSSSGAKSPIRGRGFTCFGRGLSW